jgi:hypothetical protein
MIPLSYSSMKLAECPFAFNAEKIAKTHVPIAGTAAENGKAVHEALAAYLLHCRDNNVQSDLDCLANIAQNDVNIKNAPDSDRCSELLSTFGNSEFVNIPSGADHIQIESKFELDLSGALLAETEEKWPFVSGCAFRGVKDYSYLLDDAAYVIDWKTGWDSIDQIQLQLYAWSMFESVAKNGLADRIQRVVTVIYNLATKRKQVQEYTASDLVDFWGQIRAKIEEVNSWTEFPAIACGHCRWCTVPACPVRLTVNTSLVTSPKSPVMTIPDKELTSSLQAEDAVRFLVFLEVVQKQVNDLLRAYVEANGPIATMGKVAELRPNEPWKVKNLKTLVSTLGAYGIPPEQIWDALSISESAVERLMKRNRMMERLPMVLALGERKQYAPRFGIFNDSINA